MVCSITEWTLNYTPGAKNGSAPGGTFYIGLHKGKNKFFLSETIRTKALILSM